MRNISLLLLFIGMLIRVLVLLQDRSLRIDEANLAMNIAEKSYSEMFGSLNYDQYAPPVYLCISKFSSQIFGMNELALKLPVFLAGLFSCLMFWLILRVCVKENVALWYGLLLFAFSVLIIRYSTEFKQYAVDMAMTLYAVFFALKYKIEDISISKSVGVAVVGAIMIWTSMPIVFVLSAIGIVYLFESFHRERSKIIPLLMIGLFWFGNFITYYVLILKNDATGSNLLSYHEPYFLKVKHLSWDVIVFNLDLLDNFLRMATDKTFLSKMFAGLLLGIGSYFLIRKKRRVAALLLIPLVLTILVSAFQLYSLIDRMVVFLIPLVWIIMVIGVEFLWPRLNVVARVLLILMMLITLFNTKGYEYVYKKMEFEDIKGVLTYVKENKKNDDLIFVQNSAVPAFKFYNAFHDYSYQFENYHLANWNDLPNNPTIGKNNFWIVFSNTYPQSVIDKNISAAKEVGEVVNQYISEGASTYRIQKTKN